MGPALSNHENCFCVIIHSVSSQQHELLEPSALISNRTAAQSIAAIRRIRCNSKSSIHPSLCDHNLGSNSAHRGRKHPGLRRLGRSRAISPYSAPRMRSNEPYSPWECEYGKLPWNVLRIRPQAIQFFIWWQPSFSFLLVAWGICTVPYIHRICWHRIKTALNNWRYEKSGVIFAKSETERDRSPFSYEKVIVHYTGIITRYKTNACTLVMSHFY